MDSVLLESPIDPAFLSSLKDTLRALGKDVEVYLLPDAVVLVKAGRGDDLGLSNEEEPIGRSLPDSVLIEQEATDESIGRASPGDFSGWNKDKQTRIATGTIGEQELFIWDIIRPMRQTTPNTCVLVAAAMCVDGLHRLAYEALYRSDSFLLKAKRPDKLMRECYYDDRLWDLDGVTTPKKVGQVFEKIKKDGLLTEDGDDIRLTISEWKMHERGSLIAEDVKRRLREQGPFVGILFTTSEYYNKKFLARSDGGWNGRCFPGYTPDRTMRKARREGDKAAGSHAVVCDGYWHGAGGEALHIRVKDKHSDKGPIRWVHLGTFDCFFTIAVEALPTAIPVVSLDRATATAVLTASPKKEGCQQRRGKPRATRKRPSELTPESEREKS
ncbi:unnamed protein product [Urochloa humidicola]